MAFCPNCSAALPDDSVFAECWNCHASFGEDSVWKPLRQPIGPFRKSHKQDEISARTTSHGRLHHLRRILLMWLPKDSARAARYASVATACSWLIAFVPVANLLALIVLMLPLWFLHDLGVPGLGRPTEGFFVPSIAGWTVLTIAGWLIWFLIFLKSTRRTSPVADD